jgi:hypothetical protein
MNKADIRRKRSICARTIFDLSHNIASAVKKPAAIFRKRVYFFNSAYPDESTGALLVRPVRTGMPARIFAPEL